MLASGLVCRQESKRSGPPAILFFSWLPRSLLSPLIHGNEEKGGLEIKAFTSLLFPLRNLSNKALSETDRIPLGSWLVPCTAQRYFYGEETIVEMSSCHFIVMTLFFLQDCRVLWYFYICFCLTLLLVNIKFLSLVSPAPLQVP